MKSPVYPAAQAILAAILFGASAPLAKWLLGSVEPVPLAAFLYLGSGLGLAAFRILRRLAARPASAEAGIARADLPWLAGATAAGGVAAPIALLFGLRHTPAATASLLLNFEGVATALLAAIAFQEPLGRRVWGAVAAMTLASALLSWGGGQWGISLGALGVLGACLLWGVDNNLTRGISAKDPLAIAMVKGLAAGAFSLALAVVLRQPFPNPASAARAMLLGSVSYGASVALFILALRDLGAARTSAFFGSAPFAGALLSLLLFGETPTALFGAAALLMAAGAALLLSEDHAHVHVHPAFRHDHRHCHTDRHHTHHHPEGELPPDGSHSHPHTHEATEHSHPHAPDIHHRHRH